MTPIAAYALQRFPARVFVPAITLHAAAAWSTSGSVRSDLNTMSVSWPAVAAALTLMTLLFVQFRLWDDLEDAESDRAAHADRVLVRSRREPFRILLIGLTVIGAALFATRGVALAGFAGLCTLSWLAYRVVRPHIADPLWRYGFLLMKYPAFVWLVANTVGRPVPARLAAATLTAYIGTCLYEVLHDDLHDRLGVAP